MPETVFYHADGACTTARPRPRRPAAGMEVIDCLCTLVHDRSAAPLTERRTIHGAPPAVKPGIAAVAAAPGGRHPGTAAARIRSCTGPGRRSRAAARRGCRRTAT